MLEIFKEIIKVINKDVKLPRGSFLFIVLTVVLISSFMLFMPYNLLNCLGLGELRTKRLALWGLFFVGSVSSLIAYAFIRFIPGKITIMYGKRYLNNLTDEEKSILKMYIYWGKKTQTFSMSDGVVNGLELKNIIYRASSLSECYSYFPYNIQPWAWEYLNKHKYLLD